MLGCLVVLDFSAAGFVATDCAKAETDLLLFHVDLDDLELVLHAGFELRRLAGLVACFGDVAKTLNPFSNLDEGAELRSAQNLAMHEVANTMSCKEALPHVRLQLLDAQREAAVLRLNAENNSLHLFALLHNFRRMLDALGPAQV